MKNLFLLLLLSSILVGCRKVSKYTIGAQGRLYQTDAYSKDSDGCIVFKNDCGCGGEPETVTVCGNYSIVKNYQNEDK